MLDVVVRRAAKLLDLVRRHAEQPGNVGGLEVAAFDELGVAVLQPEFVVLHAALKHGHLAAVGAAVQALPTVAPLALGVLVLPETGVFDPARRAGIVAEEPGRVGLHGQPLADGLAAGINGADAHDSVITQAAQVPNLAAGVVVPDVALVGVDVAVITPAFDHLNFHAVGVKRQKLGDFAPAVGGDLVEGVAAQRQVSLHHQAPLKRVLEAVGAPAQQPVKPVVSVVRAGGAIRPVAVQVERHDRKAFGQHLDAGVHRAERERAFAGHVHARGRLGAERHEPEVSAWAARAAAVARRG